MADIERFGLEADAENDLEGVEDVEDPLMRNVRYMDKLIDELAKGKAMEKILRQ